MRMRWVAVVLAPVLLGTAPIQNGADSPLRALAFMAGCWRGAVDDSTTIEETWTAADGDVMLATTRYLRGERVVNWEFSRVHADSAGIHLTPYPDGEPRPPFTWHPSAEGMAIFRNADNDFPQNIIYRGDGARALRVRLEGSGQHAEWRMDAGACGT